jgi:hypothetical protein
MYTEQEKDLHDNIAYRVVAYDRRRDLYYKGEIFRYRGDIFESNEMFHYIKSKIAKSDVIISQHTDNSQFIILHVNYGSICGASLQYELELWCRQDVAFELGKQVSKSAEEKPSDTKISESNEEKPTDENSKEKENTEHIIKTLAKENDLLKKEILDLKTDLASLKDVIKGSYYRGLTF